MYKSILLFFALLAASHGLRAQQESSGLDASKTYNLLFVGTSLTYTNNLPKLVKEVAKQKGMDLKVKMIASPNYALVDHWNEGKVQKLINSKKYDFVIIQQGPSSQEEGRRMLLEDGKNFASLCKSNGAKLCYFMVWPSVSRNYTMDEVIKNHRDAATTNNAILLPVGEVWKAHMDSTGRFDYYGHDGFHPSLKGSQVAAETIVQYLSQD